MAVCDLGSGARYLMSLQPSWFCCMINYSVYESKANEKTKIESMQATKIEELDNKSHKFILVCSIAE